MAAPFNAASRIVFIYSVSGLYHLAHYYCRNAQDVGGTWKINSRALDENDITFHEAVDSLALGFEQIGSSTTGVGAAKLQKLEGANWIDKDVYTPAFTPNAATFNTASQFTLTLRDKGNYHVKVVVMEGRYGPGPALGYPTAGDVNMDAFIGYFTTSGSPGVYPFDWLVGRSNQYLATSPFIRGNISLNRKLRRARGWL